MVEGEASGRALDGTPLPYTWNAEVRAMQLGRGAAPWFRFQAWLHLPKPLRLDQGREVEPQIVLWLNRTSGFLEGQSLSWRRVLLTQPTRNSLGAWGNDLPAVYLQDANTGIETMMFFDLGAMSWMSSENVPRLLAYRCTTHVQLDAQGHQHRGIGLVTEQATGDVLPAGVVGFNFWLLQRANPRLVTEPEGVTRWMEALLPIFPESLSARPAPQKSWQTMAEGTVEDWQDPALAQVTIGSHIGLRSYVKNTSKLWGDTDTNFELMTQTDVLWPALLFQKLRPNPEQARLFGALLDSLPEFYRPAAQMMGNDFVRKSGPELADSWYPFENALVKYPMIGMLAESKRLTDLFLESLAGARRLATSYDYLFPIYYDLETLQAQGAGTNYAIGGLYAWGALLAEKLTNDAGYRAEARNAVNALTRVPAERLFHEPQELGFGALAAAELGMPEAARYLLYQQLRMFYWCADARLATHDIRGMVQAAASILYPAFKENVESILPWTALMRRGIGAPELLPFLDQQRRNNFAYFDARLAVTGPGTLPHIPLENLGTTELGGSSGIVGREIYGSGEVLWMAMMFEALGRVEDRELMLVNLDLLDITDAATFPPRILNFILYNPTAQPRPGLLTLPCASGAPVRWLEVQGETATPSSDQVTVAAGAMRRLIAEW